MLSLSVPPSPWRVLEVRVTHLREEERDRGRSERDGVFALRHRDAVRDHDWRAARIATRVPSIDLGRSKGFRPFSEVCDQQEAVGWRHRQSVRCDDSFENGSGVAAHFDLALNS